MCALSHWSDQNCGRALAILYRLRSLVTSFCFGMPVNWSIQSIHISGTSTDSKICHTPRTDCSQWDSSSIGKVDMWCRSNSWDTSNGRCGNKVWSSWSHCHLHASSQISSFACTLLLDSLLIIALGHSAPVPPNKSGSCSARSHSQRAPLVTASFSWCSLGCQVLTLLFLVFRNLCLWSHRCLLAS